MQEKPSKQRAALLGGIIIGAISGVPGLGLINCCCCAGVMIGGVIAVYLYQQEFVEGMPPLESSDALILGIMSGIVGAVGGTVISAFISWTFGPLEAELVKSIMEKIVDRLEEQGSVPSGTFEELRSQLDKSIQEGTSIGGVLRSLVISLLIYPIFAMLGGLIGYGMFRTKTQPGNPSPQAHSS